MTNFDSCIQEVIKDNTSDVLKRLLQLEPEERYCLIMEHIENVCSPLDFDDVMMVPSLSVEVDK
tara:strand:+ start:2284 stop:2475 length:192 start_codon:yes stop_codon:yes gene_type:complete